MLSEALQECFVRYPVCRVDHKTAAVDGVKIFYRKAARRVHHLAVAWVFLVFPNALYASNPSARRVRASSATGRTSTQPRDAPGILAATRIASSRSLASIT